MAINRCPECLTKLQTIDCLVEENQCLKQRLRNRERKNQDGFFGSSTPSSKIPIKSNAIGTDQHKPKGARPGHKGSGRKPLEHADRVIEIPAEVETSCPDCGCQLQDKGTQQRVVMESQPIKAQQLLYRLAKKYCPRCQKIFMPSTPSVLPKSLYGKVLLRNKCLKSAFLSWPNCVVPVAVEVISK